MTAVQLIVGLGGPGPEYDQTRRNTGALFIEHLMRAQDVSLMADRKRFDLVSKFSHQGKNARLLIPTAYMSHNDQSVTALAGFFRITPNAILAAHDELDMPPGVAKLKTDGGHGGHNGLRGTITQLGNWNFFHRLRLGIGHPGHSSPVSGYVLGRAPCSEQELLGTSIGFALGMLPEMFTGDWARTIQKLHSQKVRTTFLAPV